ncbi:DNA-formamidopyrimidine glycosylase family protein [Nocardioides sp.]|jgi:endonuclease-8|uniref:DNA-formamidopyrimidine glycosylase family protein n=1 Tax=Nocardioides sp. TaxID=35761 RepID=UPI002B51A3F1|nr:DNA-formamidopyrimidine glycosylase family protein [Nocardioides sp.]HVX54075.1 DNA-formamidopyrimidine glycosylase family protein [Nocardioides sp.]
MPEGDAVLRTARLLDRALSGRVLTGTDFRVPRLATVDLAGQPVHSTAARGKHLLTRIGDLTLHTHLKMEGIWRIRRAGERWPRLAHQARVILTAGDIGAIGFALGTVELWPTAQERGRLDHLGPDLLGPDWDLDEAVRRLRQHPEAQLFEALRDQRNLAGIGTIYAAETAFLSGVHPLTPVDAVPDLPRLLERTREMLRAEWSMSRRLWVYGRHRQPCRRCGTPVVRLQVGPPGRERPAYLCPSCQRRK